MKKFLALLLGLIMVMSCFVACSKTADPTEATESGNQSGGPSSDSNTDDSTIDYDFEGKWTSTISLSELAPAITSVTITANSGSSTTTEDNANSTEPTTEGQQASEPVVSDDEPITDTTEEDTKSAAQAALDELTKKASETTITYTLTFTGDKYTMSINEKELNAAADAIVDIYIEHLRLETDASMTTEAFLADNKLSEEDFRADVVDALSSSSTEEGSWTLKDGKLTLGKDIFTFIAFDETEFEISSNDTYFTYTKAE